MRFVRGTSRLLWRPSTTVTCSRSTYFVWPFKKNILTRFRIVSFWGYIFYINNKLYGNKNDQQKDDPSHQDYLRARVKQRVLRWFILSCTCKRIWNKVQQELRFQEASHCLPQSAFGLIPDCLSSHNKVPHGTFLFGRGEYLYV